MEINSNTLKVDDKGRVTFSGLGSGIDFEGAVDNIIAAKRIPVDRMEARIESNAAKIAAYQSLRTVLSTLQNSLATLRGAVSYDNSSNVFATKEAFASVSRTDGATASSAGSLIGVTVTNSAQAESHDIEILQVARAHKIASDSFASTTTAIGFTDSNTFSIEGTTITVSAQDTLLTLRDRINAANTGTSATGVSASIVTVSSTEHYLVLSKATAGTDITISDTTGTPLVTAGILTGGGVPANVLQASQTAQLYADGLMDSTNITYETARLASSSTTIGSSGTLRFNDGTTTLDLAYTSGLSITTLASNINADATLQTMGISASVVQEGAEYRLKIETTGAAFTIAEQGAGSAITDLGIDNSRLLIERNTNTVSDLFTGITLSLFQSEVGTNVHVDIEKNLSSIKTQVTSFIDAYNAVKVAINTQTAIDTTTGVVSPDAVLFGSRALADIESQLTQIMGVGTQGVSTAFSVLAQIGITFVDNSTLSDPLQADTLTIDSSKLDNALLNNSDDVKRLLTFDFSSSDPRITLLSFGANTTYNASGYVLNVAFSELYESAAQTEAGAITLTQANTGGPAADGISAITLSDVIADDHAMRYSYDSATEVLTLYDLTAGTSETVDITASLDALVGVGLDLGAGQTLDVAFATFGTITLSGDNGFLRGSDISDGTLDVSALDPGTTMTGGTVTTPTTTMNKATVDALIAAGAYSAATGLLTLGVTSSGAGEAHFDLASGIKFRVDGGSVTSDISATDLDDGLSHTVDVYVNDGSSDVLVASLSLTTLASTGAGSGSLTIDIGTGLFAEATTVASATAPMENYLAISSGSFAIRDSSGTLISTISYATGDSLTDVAATIDAVSGLTASVVDNGTTFQLRVTSDTSMPLTFDTDTGGLLALIDVTNTGTTVVSANINGAADGSDDGSVTVGTGNALTATSLTGAYGLQLLYTGNTDASTIQLDFTTGLGSLMYFSVENILNETTGSIENEIQGLTDQTDFTQERIDAILERLQNLRASLLSRFIAMESALSTMNSMLNQIKQSFTALTNSQSN